MKSLLIFLTFSISTVIAQSGSPTLMEEFNKIEKQNGDPLPEDLFLDTTWCKQEKGLQYITKTFHRMKAFRHPDGAKSTGIIQVNDIRWVFDSPQEAMDFHYKFISINSENGVELKDHSVHLPHVDTLQIFRESENLSKMNKAFGIDANMYYFLFVQGNVVGKLFVNTASTVGLEEAAELADKASNRILSYNQ